MQGEYKYVLYCMTLRHLKNVVTTHESLCDFVVCIDVVGGTALLFHTGNSLPCSCMRNCNIILLNNPLSIT